MSNIALFVTAHAAERALSRLGMDIHDLTDAALDARSRGTRFNNAFIHKGITYGFSPDLKTLKTVYVKGDE